MSERKPNSDFHEVPSYRMLVLMHSSPPRLTIITIRQNILQAPPPDVDKPRNAFLLYSFFSYLETSIDRALLKGFKPERPCRYKSPNATQYKVYVLSLIAEYELQHRLCTAKEAIHYAIDRFEEERGIRLSYEQVRNWYNEKGKSNASTT